MKNKRDFIREMPKAILLFDNDGTTEKYEIDFSMVRKGNRSAVYTGQRYPITFSDGKCTYVDMFENIYSFTVPDFSGKDIFGRTERIMTYHDNNRQRFYDVKKPGGTWYTRVIFCNKELRNKIQILFLYNGALEPQDLPDGIFEKELYIQKDLPNIPLQH